MTHSIELEGLNIECTDEEWDGRLRQFVIEGHNDGEFLAGRFPELTVEVGYSMAPALADALSLARRRGFERFERALHSKYRMGGEEFAGDEDYGRVWGVLFATALDAAEEEGGGLVAVEIYYWAILQLLRTKRGLLTDKLYHGAETRLGQYIGDVTAGY